MPSVVCKSYYLSSHATILVKQFAGEYQDRDWKRCSRQSDLIEFKELLLLLENRLAEGRLDGLIEVVEAKCIGPLQDAPTVNHLQATLLSINSIICYWPAVSLPLARTGAIWSFKSSITILKGR